VQRCFAEGVAEYDFLRGSEPYKLKWANGARQTVRLRARDASLRARLHDTGRTLYWRLREASKRALPPETLEWARRTRDRVFR
jgi:CelD/BcsL family acetyltransferase involved in cellulose biosynthesis